MAGYDQKKGTIRIYNTGPGWGEPTTEGGPRDGRLDGLADLSFEEFCRDFKGIALESDRPYEAEEFGYGMLHHRSSKRYPHWS